MTIDNTGPWSARNSSLAISQQPGNSFHARRGARSRAWRRSGVTWRHVCLGAALAIAGLTIIAIVAMQNQTESASDSKAWQGCVDGNCRLLRKRFVHMYDFAMRHYAIYDIQAGKLAERSCLPKGHIPVWGDPEKTVTATRFAVKYQGAVVWWDKSYRSAQTRMIFSDDRGAAYQLGKRLLVIRDHWDYREKR